jgi:hypothetical protein
MKKTAVMAPAIADHLNKETTAAEVDFSSTSIFSGIIIFLWNAVVMDSQLRKSAFKF